MIKRIKSILRAIFSKEYKNKKINIHPAGFVSEDCFLHGNNYVGPRCVVSGSVVGRFSYISSRTRVSRANIGKYCSIAQDCQIGGLSKHPSNMISTNPIFYSKNNILNHSLLFGHLSFKEVDSVFIGNDVWIGARAMILDGVKIGDGAIIAAGSVVVRDVEPFQIVGGVPARFIKNRLPDCVIKKIISDPWWIKDDEEILKLAKDGYFTNEY